MAVCSSNIHGSFLCKKYSSISLVRHFSCVAEVSSLVLYSFLLVACWFEPRSSFPPEVEVAFDVWWWPPGRRQGRLCSTTSRALTELVERKGTGGPGRRNKSVTRSPIPHRGGGRAGGRAGRGTRSFLCQAPSRTQTVSLAPLTSTVAPASAALAVIK